MRKRQVPHRRGSAVIARRGFRSAAASALVFCAALAAAGCGIGPGAGLGQVHLTVTRDYGSHRILATTDHVAESDTVMRVLDRNASIATRYGGRFVQSIAGLEGEEIRGRHYDWLFYVNGIESGVGAADYSLHGGDAIWWDYRDWTAAVHVPAVVGSWPQPFTGGYDGRRRPVAVECAGGGDACVVVRRSLEGEGVSVSGGSTRRSIRVLVGPWDRVRDDRAAAQIDAGPTVSGVFAGFRDGPSGLALWGLDEAATPVRRFGPDAGLLAATRHYEEPPVWLVTGATARGVDAAARMLDSRHLRDHYAIAVEGSHETPLPLPLNR